MSVNKVTLLGNLGDTPELRYTTTEGLPVCNMRVATHDYKKKDGQSVKETEWHRVSVFGKQAENCAQYLTKGRQIYLEGKLKTRSWTDKEGITRYTTEIIASTVEFLGSGRRSEEELGTHSTQAEGFHSSNVPTNLAPPQGVPQAVSAEPIHPQPMPGPVPTNLAQVMGVGDEENN